MHLSPVGSRHPCSRVKSCSSHPQWPASSLWKPSGCGGCTSRQPRPLLGRSLCMAVTGSRAQRVAREPRLPHSTEQPSDRTSACPKLSTDASLANLSKSLNVPKNPPPVNQYPQHCRQGPRPSRWLPLGVTSRRAWGGGEGLT